MGGGACFFFGGVWLRASGASVMSIACHIRPAAVRSMLCQLSLAGMFGLFGVLGCVGVGGVLAAFAAFTAVSANFGLCGRFGVFGAFLEGRPYTENAYAELTSTKTGFHGHRALSRTHRRFHAHTDVLGSPEDPILKKINPDQS